MNCFSATENYAKLSNYFKKPSNIKKSARSEDLAKTKCYNSVTKDTLLSSGNARNVETSFTRLERP